MWSESSLAPIIIIRPQQSECGSGWSGRHPHDDCRLAESERLRGRIPASAEMSQGRRGGHVTRPESRNNHVCAHYCLLTLLRTSYSILSIHIPLSVTVNLYRFFRNKRFYSTCFKTTICISQIHSVAQQRFHGLGQVKRFLSFLSIHFSILYLKVVRKCV